MVMVMVPDGLEEDKVSNIRGVGYISLCCCMILLMMMMSGGKGQR